MLALDTPVYTVRHARVEATHAPGVLVGGCEKRKCALHTSDWRSDPGAPENTHRVRADLVRVPLREVLSFCYRTEAHFAAYALEQNGAFLARQPRIAKDALPWLREQGLEVKLTCLLADWDTPNHEPWSHESLPLFEALWASGAGPLKTAGVYLSPKGARVIQPLATPLRVEEGERVLRLWLDELVAVGVDPSVRQVKDWTRLMRTANHMRAGNMQVRTTLVDTSRMVAIDLPVPAESPLARRAPRRTSLLPTPGGHAPVVPLGNSPLPSDWEPVADALGAAIRDTVSSDWRRCYLALSGALCSRGCPLGAVPAVIVHAHKVDPRWLHQTADRAEIARSTAARFASGLEVSGYATLRASFPGVADALDATTTTGAEASVLRQLAVPAARPVSVGDAVATITRAVREARGVVLIAAPPGTGKTHGVIEYAKTLPAIEKRAAPGSRLGITAPSHRLAKQTAAQIASLHLFSPVSHTSPTGKPTCVYHEAAKSFASGGQSVRKEFCLGRGEAPCPHVVTCPAVKGEEGESHANLVVGVHQLTQLVTKKIGARSTLVIDEPGEVLEQNTITSDDCETALRYLDAFEPAYTAKIKPALAAFSLWISSAGDPDATGMTTLEQCVREGVGTTDDPATVLALAREAIPPGATSPAPPLLWRSVFVARSNPARAAELGTASRVLSLLRAGLLSVPPAAARIDTRTGERSATLVGPNAHLAAALEHKGAVVLLDANAGLHRAAIEKALRTPVPFIDLVVADGAPITRTVIASSTANRNAWMPHGVPDWHSILPMLRAAIHWLNEVPTAKAALLTWREMRAGIEYTLRPEAPETLALLRTSKLPKRSLIAAKELLAPILSLYEGELRTAHYNALEGLNHLADCDATITLGDPRPNLGIEADKAAYLGLAADGRLDALAAAELQQAHGRLRTIHRTRPGRQLHCGVVVPAGWPGVAVEVRRAPLGRPRSTAAMSAEEFRTARERAGLSGRKWAALLGIGAASSERYEAGTRPVPASVARAVSAIGVSGAVATPSAPETPVRDSYTGVSGAVDTVENCVPAIGVSGPADEQWTEEPTEAERSALGEWLASW